MHGIIDSLILPWPPSANRYWRFVKGMVLVSEEARRYRGTIKKLSLVWKRPQLKGRLQISIQAYPPDNRGRDLDNCLKIVLDSLEKAKLFVNDSQFDKIIIERAETRENGELHVNIEEIA